MNKKLDAREKRAFEVLNFFKSYPRDSLIVIQANMPSSLTNKPIHYYLIKIFSNIIKDKYDVKLEGIFKGADGPYILLKKERQNIDFKRELVEIEESHPLGRLIDLDYFIEPKKSISRSDLNLKLRSCFICNQVAYICIRNQTHGVKEVEDYINQSFFNYIKDYLLKMIDYSILRELEIENKFGLVTKTSSGNHLDMDYHLMVKAKDAIMPYFGKLFALGYRSNNLQTLLKKARKIGIEAEHKMFEATGGINAYKGIIFLIGIVVLAFGYTLKTSYDYDDIFSNIKTLSKNIYDDFNIYDDTFTTTLFKEHKIAGIREVAKSGLKIVYDHHNFISKDSNDDELRNLLFKYILASEDTIFIKRSKSYHLYLKHKHYLQALNPLNKKELKLINDYCRKHNLSFGGSADLLIVTILLVHLKSIFI